MSRFRFPTVVAIVLLALHSTATAQSPAASTKGGMDALFVLNARSARLDNKTLSLDGVSSQAIVFADRPVRRAGQMMTADFLNLWTTGSFAQSAPNATVSVFTRNGSRISDAVVELKSPHMEGDRVVFHAAVLQGSLEGADGPASIFFDTVWFGLGGGDGIHYLGQNDTSGGTSPSIGNGRDGYSTGWPNPAPDGRPSSQYPSNGPPPLSVPPGSR
jgi:hypothetical protein